jgi:hypothetical protein
MTCNIRYFKDNLKVFDTTIDVGTGGGGAGSLDNEKIILCKICTSNGYPHEPIIFRKVVIEKWFPFEYFKPWQKHQHKIKTTSVHGDIAIQK